jgi:sugar lactone lactonase YvrE
MKNEIKLSKFRRILKIGLFVSILVAVVLLVSIRLFLGGGEYYEDISTAPLFGEDKLEIVATLEMPPGNLAVSKEGRLFFNYHPFSGPQVSSVFELINGNPIPYPNAEFQDNFNKVLGMFIDSHNRLWTLDFAEFEDRQSRLLAFDLSTGHVVHDHFFKSDDDDFLNDLQVSPDGKTIYITNPGIMPFKPASMVVYDIETKTLRHVLVGHDSVNPQHWLIHTDAGDFQILFGLVTLKVGVDGIAISKDGEWIYYGAMVHDSMYRIRTSDLLNESLPPEELGNRVERIGKKPLSDGMSADLANNIYITDVEHSGIARMAPDGTLQTLIKDKRVLWADGISFGPDNYIYFTDSELPHILTDFMTPPPIEQIIENAPYHIFRFKSDIRGVPGS